MTLLPRLLHPAAWWLWALCLAYAAMRTTNPLLLVEIAAVAGLVVSARRGQAPWANAYALLLKLGLATIVITIAIQLVIGARVPGHELFRLPSVTLPSWMNGLSLGGAITGEALLNSFTSGLRLAVLVACFGAANALAHPARLVRILPAALYEVGVAIVVAMTFVPQLAESLVRVRAAQRLRGRPIAGLRGLRGIAVPVLEEALERAIGLAASMDSRGYGRRTGQRAAVRRLSAAALLLGLGGAIAGTYQVIGGAGRHGLGIALLVAGPIVALAGGLLAGRRGRRTRYRPDPWRWPEWLVLGCGAAVVVAYVLGVDDSLAAGVPYAWPTLKLVPFLVTLVAALPAFLTPPVPAGSARAVSLAVAQ
ncbi:MAG: energy-coupling factor transporter transmembrane component T [Jatrophihabitantaceae bacterium]